MGEGEQEENRTSNLLHIHCAPQEQTERELSVLEEVGCKSVLLNGHYVLSKSIVSWSPGLTISHCGKCKGQFVKSQFSRSLPSFSVSRTVPLRMFCSRCPSWLAVSKGGLQAPGSGCEGTKNLSTLLGLLFSAKTVACVSREMTWGKLSLKLPIQSLLQICSHLWNYKDASPGWKVFIFKGT